MNGRGRPADPPRPGPRPHRRRVRHRPRHLPSPATHRPRPRASEDRRAPRLGRRCDRRPALPRRPPPQRGGRPCAGPTLTSATATMSSSPSVARRPTRPEVERTCDVWSAAARPRFRSLHAAISPEPGDSVVGLGVDQINRRFAAACAAAGLEGQRTSHGGRVGLAVELTARGASTHAIRLAGGWKNRAIGRSLRRDRQHARRSHQPARSNPPGSHWRRSPPLRRRTTTKGPST